MERRRWLSLHLLYNNTRLTSSPSVRPIHHHNHRRRRHFICSMKASLKLRPNGAISLQIYYYLLLVRICFLGPLLYFHINNSHYIHSSVFVHHIPTSILNHLTFRKIWSCIFQSSIFHLLTIGRHWSSIFDPPFSVLYFQRTPHGFPHKKFPEWKPLHVLASSSANFVDFSYVYLIFPSFTGGVARIYD